MDSHSDTVGNAAAMREALEKIYLYAQSICEYKDEPAMVCRRADLIERAVNAALSAPPRNCDVGTEEEQIERLYGGETCPSCKSPQMTSDGCACVREGPCALRWAQTPYEAEEGAGE